MPFMNIICIGVLSSLFVLYCVRPLLSDRLYDICMNVVICMFIGLFICMLYIFNIPIVTLVVGLVSITVVFIGLGSIFIPLVEVDGESMLPTFQDGDLVTTVKVFRKTNVVEGDIYVYTRTSVEGFDYYVIKRAIKVEGDYIFFEGDNKEGSVDSRHYGMVHKKYVKYHVRGVI
ncbi:MAG: S26 family signal peptidase [Peptostreptococcaceae bacterium]